jgi:outer membrane protein OmpA-like peptidoglycan-associated protein
MGFILKVNGYEGYFSSNRNGGLGSDDVYHFMDPAMTSWLGGGGTTPDGRPQNDIKDSTGTQLIDPVTGKPARPSTGGSTAGATPAKRPLTAEEKEMVGKVEKLQFLYDYNSVELLSESRKMLDYVAGVLKQHPDWKLMVLSFTDSRGGDQYNTDLSALRCYAVIDYLAAKGISPKRLYYRNMGEQNLVNPCKDGVPCTEQQQRQNRRSELRVIY